MSTTKTAVGGALPSATAGRRPSPAPGTTVPVAVSPVALPPGALKGAGGSVAAATGSRRPSTARCDAWHDGHDGHDCTAPGACGRALIRMLDRIGGRAPIDRDPTPPHGLTRPLIVRALRP